MVRTIYSFLIVSLLIATTGVYASDTIVVGDFLRSGTPGELPDQWEVLTFDGVSKQTSYQHRAEEGEKGVQAISQGGASGLIRRIVIDPAHYPILSFSWKIAGVIAGANLQQKSGDDAPARVYVTFAYDASKVGFWEMVKFEAIKFIYGEYPPIASLVYVWASNSEQGTFFDNPYTDRVKVFVLETGAEKKGQWLTEHRNIVQDYVLAFGESEVPMVSGVAIMTDSDNTGGSATAWYGNILFSKQGAEKDVGLDR